MALVGEGDKDLAFGSLRASQGEISALESSVKVCAK